MNINMLRDDENDAGFWAAAAASDPLATWAGAVLHRSLDGGSSYSSIAAITHEATMGVTTEVLGDFHSGNIPDELNSVNVVLSQGSLSSTTYAGLLAGANMAVIGDEILYFRNATLESNGSYTLRGLLRGRRGSEYAMATHEAADRFILVEFSKLARIAQVTADIGIGRYYKPVSVGSSLATTTAQTFTNEGCGLKPYAPVLLGGGRDASGNWTLHWTRRGRIGGEWRDSADVPLGELTEAYSVDIYTDATLSTIVRTIECSTTTAPYSTADQTSDFGFPQVTVYFAVYQLSATVGRGHGAAWYATTAAGAPPVSAPVPPSTPPVLPDPPPRPGSIGALPTTFTRPALSVSIATHGAVADGETDNLTAISAAIAAAVAAGHKTVWVPAGTWAYSSTITQDDGVKLTGAGQTSILHALDWTNRAIFLTGDGSELSSVKLTTAGVVDRQAPYEYVGVVPLAASNFTIYNVFVEGGGAAGIQMGSAANYGHISYCTVRNTLADSIHNADGTHHMTIEYNFTENSGDDGIAAVTYDGTTGYTSHIVARYNHIKNNVGGRGMSAVGSQDIHYHHNIIEGVNAAGVYISQEDSFATKGNTNVLVEYNTISDCGNPGMGHAAVMVFSDGTYPNDNIDIVRNDIICTGTQDGIRYFGPQTNILLDSNRITDAVNDYVGGVDPDVTIIPYSSGVVGAGTDTFPSGSVVDGSYPYGTSPTQTPADMLARIQSQYDAWKAGAVIDNPAISGAKVIHFNSEYLTVSEGMGYGMLLCVLFAGHDQEARDTFDALMTTVRANPATGIVTYYTPLGAYLMDWRLYPNGASAGDGWNAMDGDLDIAMALLMAHRQWGSAGAWNYQQEALNTIAALKAYNYKSDGTCKGLPNADTCRTSDFMIGHFRAFGEATGDSFWDTVIDRCYDLMELMQGSYSTAGLIPDFIMNTNTTPIPSRGGFGYGDGNYDADKYWWNACRIPWRLASDYVWSGDARNLAITSSLIDFFEAEAAGDATNIGTGYALDGTQLTGGDSAAYMAPILAGACVDAGYQTFVDLMWDWNDTHPIISYYDGEIQLLSMVVASGNWWKP